MSKDKPVHGEFTIGPRVTLTKDELRERHQQLHQAFDELFACFIEQHRNRFAFLKLQISELMAWSHQMTLDPTCVVSEDTASPRVVVHLVNMTQPATATLDDPELFAWLVAAHEHAGDFLRTLAEAGLRADAENYPLLRPVLLAMKAKYPKYAKTEDRQS